MKKDPIKNPFLQSLIYFMALSLFLSSVGCQSFGSVMRTGSNLTAQPFLDNIDTQQRTDQSESVERRSGPLIDLRKTSAKKLILYAFLAVVAVVAVVVVAGSSYDSKTNVSPLNSDRAKALNTNSAFQKQKSHNQKMILSPTVIPVK